MNNPAPKPPDHYEQRVGHAEFSPVGEVSLNQVSELVSRAIIFARDHQIERLLADITGLTGFPSPSVVDRYWLIRQWANVAKSRVAVALVVEPHLIDPERFGVTVAANSGLRGDVFAVKTEALEWLLSSRPCRVSPAASGIP
jgi:hypothetical protein